MTGARRWTEATVDLAAVPAGGMSVRLAAGEEDLRAIADRLQIPAVEDCTATFALRPEPGRGGTLVEGRLSARLTRSCVVTDDPMAETVDQPVECLVVAEEPAADEDEGADEPDYEVAPDGRVDLAELAVQLLAVSMAAYPRGPDADKALAAVRDAVRGDRENAPAGASENPFAGLGARLGLPATESPGAAKTGAGSAGDEDDGS